MTRYALMLLTVGILVVADAPALGKLPRSPDPSADGKHLPPKNEAVMSPGMRIQATTPVGTIAITAVDELTRAYTWEGATRSVEMWQRSQRWNGSLGLYHPGPGEHWEEHKGITRCVVQEAQQHVKSMEEVLKWIQSRNWAPLVYRDDGLVVGWNKTLPRKQLGVEVWQVLVNGKKPARLLGSQNEKIAVTSVEIWTSPLGQAVQKKDQGVVKELLTGGADPNAKNLVGRPVLVEAAKRDSHEIVRALLEKGADPNARDEEGYTALLNAVSKGHLGTIKVLLALGADANAAMERGLLKGVTPLILAADGDADIVKALLGKGADVHAKGGYVGRTALSTAREAQREDIVRLLEEAGAKK